MNKEIEELTERRKELLSKHRKPVGYIIPTAVCYFIGIMASSIGAFVGSNEATASGILIGFIFILVAFVFLVLLIIRIAKNKPINNELHKIDARLKELSSREADDDLSDLDEEEEPDLSDLDEEEDPDLGEEPDDLDEEDGSLLEDLGEALLMEDGTTHRIYLFQENVALASLSDSSDEEVILLDDISNSSLQAGFGIIPGTLTIKDVSGATYKWDFPASKQATAQKIHDEIQRLTNPQ